MPTKRQLDPEIITRFFPEDGQTHGGINKPGILSRWFIGETDYHDLENWMPLEDMIQQTPASTLIVQIASPVYWMTCLSLNQATYLYCLGTNGHMYQVSLGGAVTDLTSGSPAFSVNSDIAIWQGSTILITDLNAAKIYSWTGSVFATVFSSQPAQFITTYAGRLWMANQNTITFTASGTYNSLGGDSGSFQVTDSDCPPPIRALFAFGGNLYVFGYTWVKIYGGLYDSGSPAVLQFTQSTLTDEAGLYSKWSLLPFGYAVKYASLFGIWSLLGSQPVFDSEKVGGFFQQLTLSGTSFSAAFAPILGVPCFMWQIQFAEDSTYRLLCQTYEQQPKWFTVNAGNINFITYGVNQATGQQQAFGIDTSNNIYTLFSNATGTVTSVAKTKMLSLGSRIREKSIGRVGAEMVVNAGATVTVTVEDENMNPYSPDLQSLNPSTAFLWTNGGMTFNWTNGGSAFNWTTRGKQYEFVQCDIPITVRKLAIDWTVTSSQAVIGAFAVESQELPADWGP